MSEKIYNNERWGSAILLTHEQHMIKMRREERVQTRWTNFSVEELLKILKIMVEEGEHLNQALTTYLKRTPALEEMESLKKAIKENGQN